MHNTEKKFQNSKDASSHLQPSSTYNAWKSHRAALDTSALETHFICKLSQKHVCEVTKKNPTWALSLKFISSDETVSVHWFPQCPWARQTL